MGKAVIILVVGVTIIIGIAATSIIGRSSDAQKSSISGFEKVNAKNIATSAAEYYFRQLKATPAQRGTFSLSPILDGTATVAIADWTVGVSDSVRLTSIGTFNGARETTIVKLRQGTGFPTITAALMLSTGSTATITQSGSSIINGNNHTVSGIASASCPGMVAGAAVSNNGSLGNVTVTANCTGSSGVVPNLIVDANTPAMLSYVSTWKTQASIIVTGNLSSGATVGTTASPAITYVNKPGGSVGFSNVTGAGILIINANISFSGSFLFKGLVILTGTGTSTMNFSGSSTIIGAAIVEGSSNVFTMSGPSTVKYSCASLDTYAKPLVNSGGALTVANWLE